MDGLRRWLDSHRGLGAAVRQSDVARAGVSLTLMGVMAATGAPLWIVLLAPALIYVGLSLWTSREGRNSAATRGRAIRGDQEAYRACVAHHREILTLSRMARNPRIAEQSRAAGAQLATILGGIAEDRKQSAAPALLELTRTTHDLLTRHAKVARRGLETADLDEQVHESLASLVEAYRRFWERLNRDAIVDLVALNELIEYGLAGSPIWTGNGGDR